MSSVRFALPIFLLVCTLCACTQHSGTPSPPSKPETRERPATQPSSVEQQLLATVKHAEGLGPGNPLLLSSIYSLATYYENQKEYDKAAAQYKQALKLKEQVNGPNHTDVAAILQRYARLLQKADRHTEAKQLLQRADAILSPSTPTSSRP